MALFDRLFGSVPKPLEPQHGEKLFDTPYMAEIEQHFAKTFPDRALLKWQDEEGMQIHLLAPTEQEPYYVAYTVGMSANQMTLDNLLRRRKYESLRTAELMMYLPADWPMAGLLARSEQPDPAVCWPLSTLYKLAKMPEKQHTWLGMGHTVPNGEPPRPFAQGTNFCGVMLCLPSEANGPREVQPVPVGDQQLMLYTVVPLYADEMDLKIRKGSDYLEMCLQELPRKTGFVVKEGRPSVTAAGQKAAQKEE